MKSTILFFDYRITEQEFFRKKTFNNYDIKFFDFSLNEANFEKLPQNIIENTMIISVFTTSGLTSDILFKFKNLRIISTRSTSVSHIDLDYCIKRNIRVVNVESYGSTAVAQYTFMLILMLIRNISEVLKVSNYNNFLFNSFVGRDLNNLSIGIVGTGAIGGAICKFANCSGMKIYAHDILEKQDIIDSYNVEYTNLDTLLENSDIVTLHIPYYKDNYRIFDKKMFELMKDNSYFINVSNQNLINIADLLQYAQNRKFNGIALDFDFCDFKSSNHQCMEFMQEIQELKKQNNVIITPHLAFNTLDSINIILEKTFEGILDSLAGGFRHRVV